MDAETINVYKKRSDYFYNKYRNSREGISKYFQIAFSDKSKILDIGAGSGIDLFNLQKLGHEVKGVDPCSDFIETFKINNPLLRDRVSVDQLPELSAIPENEKFDGILCSAVLMHIPQIQLFDSVFAIKNHLKDNGRLLISIPTFYPGINSKTNRDSIGRLFNGITPCELILLFERLGFKLLERWDDHDELTNAIWSTILFKLDAGNQIRPLDSIESILNKDKKVATYKLALVRALAEIATQNLNAVKWKQNGKVLLPVQLVVDKWIEYYWPLFESDQFIPQIQKESPEYSRPVAFRKALNEISSQYKYGYEGFYIDKMKLKLPASLLLENRQLNDLIKNTIVKGPVKHAGGYNNENKLLDFDSKTSSIIIPEAIWREFVLMGSWIIDATILRWAELTSKLSKGNIKASKIIDLLLIEERLRQVDDARRVYKNLSSLECTWTASKLNNNEFDVDHIIPFSLWKNNNLWNLVPSLRKINSEKSDKLVTSQHLVKSKERIIFYWKILSKDENTRFFNEANLLLRDHSNRKNWENELFSGLKEAIEYTAIQRGIQRWEPRIH